MFAIDDTQCAMFVPFYELSSLARVTFPGFLREILESQKRVCPFKW